MKPIHEIVMELRDSMNDILPEGVGVTITALDNGGGKGWVKLTISSWPKSTHMLNDLRVTISRRALLAGQDPSKLNLSSYPYLSPDALSLISSLEKLTESFFPTRKTEEGDLPIWDVEWSVVLDERSLERERIEIIQSMKGSRQ